MTESLFYRSIVLIVLFSDLYSVSARKPKYVCQGRTVKLFRNIKLTNDSTVNLYINGVRKTLIMTLHSGQIHFILDGYREKLSLDEYRNIWVRNVQVSEDGIYVLKYNTDTTKQKVQLNVMVAPTNDCKPSIEKTENILIASLEENDCGRPLAQVQWMKSPDITYMRKDIIKLPPELETGTYYACAESVALKRCVKTLTSSNHCTNYTVKGFKIPSVSSEIWFLKISVFVIAAVVIAIVIIGAVFLIRWIKDQVSVTEEEATENQECSDSGISREQQRQSAISKGKINSSWACTKQRTCCRTPEDEL